MSRKAALCKHRQPKSKCTICRNEYMKNYMKRYYIENESYRNNARKRLNETDKDRLYRIQQDVRILKLLRRKRGDSPNIDYSSSTFGIPICTAFIFS